MFRIKEHFHYKGLFFPIIVSMTACQHYFFNLIYFFFYFKYDKQFNIFVRGRLWMLLPRRKPSWSPPETSNPRGATVSSLRHWHNKCCTQAASSLWTSLDVLRSEGTEAHGQGYHKDTCWQIQYETDPATCHVKWTERKALNWTEEIKEM